MSEINYLAGQTPNLSSGTGTVVFPQNKFTQPPIVLLTVSPNNIMLNVCIRSVTKDYFTYYTKYCNGGVYRQQYGD